MAEKKASSWDIYKIIMKADNPDQRDVWAIIGRIFLMYSSLEFSLKVLHGWLLIGNGQMKNLSDKELKDQTNKLWFFGSMKTSFKQVEDTLRQYCSDDAFMIDELKELCERRTAFTHDFQVKYGFILKQVNQATISDEVKKQYERFVAEDFVLHGVDAWLREQTERIIGEEKMAKLYKDLENEDKDQASTKYFASKSELRKLMAKL